MKTIKQQLLDNPDQQMVLHSDPGGCVRELRASPKEGNISADERDALLLRCNAGEYVELFMQIEAFQQTPSIQNRNFVRFQDDKLPGIAASGVQSVFLKDHDQRSLESRGGTIVASSVKLDGKTTSMLQTIKLTDPAFVAKALRGLIDRFSIGWRSTGTVLCSICQTSLSKCAHWPGDQTDGKVCEAIFTDAVLVETSAVNVPAVVEAKIIGIRSASTDQETSKGKEKKMLNLAILASILGLAETASESEIATAVDSMAKHKSITALAAELDEAQKSNVVLQTRVVDLTAKAIAAENQLQSERIEALITGAVLQGKLVPGSESELAIREVAALDASLAVKLIASMANQTLVGVKAQSLAGNAQPMTELEKQIVEDQQIIVELAAKHKMAPNQYADMLASIGISSSQQLRDHAVAIVSSLAK
jgi:uncharacterized Zn finger protein (UPF0148 family)